MPLARRSCCLIHILVLGLVTTPCLADGLRDVRLIQRPIEDAPGAEAAYVEGQLRYQDFDGGSSIIFGGYGAVTVAEDFEVGTFIGFESTDPDVGDGESGLLDIDVYGRYNFAPIQTDAADIHATSGLLISLPVGSEDLLQETLDVEGFGAARFAFDTFVLTGTLGLRINGDHERGAGGGREIEGELSIFLAGGGLLPVSETVTLTGELDIETARFDGGESDVRLTPGVDVIAGETLHLRGGVGIGLSDGAPDLELILGAAVNI
jgi:hypothetical protein